MRLFSRKPIFYPLSDYIDYSVFNHKDAPVYKQIYTKNNLLNPLPNGENTSYTKFVILSTQRTGSTLLMHLLRSHTNVTCYGEIFGGVNYKFALGFYPVDRYTYKTSLKYPSEFVSRLVFRNYSDHVRAVGFKLMYNQLPVKKNIELLNACFSDQSSLVIHLKRKNILKTLVSYKLAETNKMWSRINPDIESKIQNYKFFFPISAESYRINQISLTEKECVEFFMRVKSDEHDFDRIIENKNSLNLYYEDFEAELLREACRVLIALGLSNEPLIEFITKQNTLPLSQSIINYQQLYYKMKHTEWGIYFDE